MCKMTMLKTPSQCRVLCFIGSRLFTPLKVHFRGQKAVPASPILFAALLQLVAGVASAPLHDSQHDIPLHAK
jgi:hypothetical protein